MIKVQEKLQKITTLDSSIDVIVLLVTSPDFNLTTPSYNQMIYGKSMLNHVVDAARGYNVKNALLLDNSDIINVVRSNLGDKKYTCVLFSDTPLITPSTLSNMIDYVYYKDLDCVNFTRAYVGKTEYFRKNNFTQCEISNTFEKELYRAYNFATLDYCRRVIDNMIKRYHMQAGVNMIDPNMCHIDGDCEIEQGTTLSGRNLILGSSHIGSNCIIENATIIDSIIGNNVTIKDARVVSSKVSDNKSISPYTVVDNENI